MSDKLDVSVIIPCYNHAKFIKTRIDSVLSQTYQNYEIIILDDCSTDNSKDVIETYRNNSKVSHIIFNSKNSGSTFIQWNKGISLAKSNFIWIAESDDSASPHFLEKCLTEFNINTNLAVCYTQSNMIDSNNEITGTLLWWTNERDKNRWSNNYLNNGTDEVTQFMAFQNIIMNASSALFRKDYYLKCGGAPENMKLCGDWILWMKLSVLGDVAYISEPLNNYRFHNSNVRTSTEKNTLVFWETQEARRIALQLSANQRLTYTVIQNRFISEWKNYLLSNGSFGVLLKLMGSFLRLLNYYSLPFMLKTSAMILFGKFAGSKNEK